MAFHLKRLLDPIRPFPRSLNSNRANWVTLYQGAATNLTLEWLSISFQHVVCDDNRVIKILRHNRVPFGGTPVQFRTLRNGSFFKLEKCSLPNFGFSISFTELALVLVSTKHPCTWCWLQKRVDHALYSLSRNDRKLYVLNAFRPRVESEIVISSAVNERRKFKLYQWKELILLVPWRFCIVRTRLDIVVHLTLLAFDNSGDYLWEKRFVINLRKT